MFGKTLFPYISYIDLRPSPYPAAHMSEIARDHVLDHLPYEVLGGYFSPVSDAYAKPGLASWQHRVKMCEMGISDSQWLMVDSWEPSNERYIRTARVLDHFDQMLNGEGGLEMPDGE